MKTELKFWKKVKKDFNKAADQEYLCNASPTFKAAWEDYLFARQLQADFRAWMTEDTNIRPVAENELSTCLFVRTAQVRELDELPSRRPILLAFINYKISQLS